MMVTLNLIAHFICTVLWAAHIKLSYDQANIAATIICTVLFGISLFIDITLLMEVSKL